MYDPTPLHCVVPPRLLRRLLVHDDAEIREVALSTLLTTARLRGQRELLGQASESYSTNGLSRTVQNAANNSTPSGKVMRSEAGRRSTDEAANDVYDGLGATYDLFQTVFHRDSVDGRGRRLDAVVHFGHRFNNAFWNGAQLVFGDADGKAFLGFTKSIDIIAHELTHAVTQFTCNLEYHGQSGALNESMSDVFGSMVKQYALRQHVRAADWLIGDGILGPVVPGVALRSLKAPGTAYLGDDQVSTMMSYVQTPDTDAGDWGGVHRNSGIPNHVFYLVATRLGGFAWEGAGQIWYDALLALRSNADFKSCATMTYYMAGRRFGVNSREQQEVGNAWTEVGVSVVPERPPMSVRVTAPTNAQLALASKIVVSDLGGRLEATGT